MRRAMLTRASIHQITVSSGGMLTQRLDLSDLQAEHRRSFNGTFAYAQHKVKRAVRCAQAILIGVYCVHSAIK
jgi:hypothetical protein